MPNSSEVKIHYQQVSPADHKREDLWVALLVVSILVVASCLLLLRQNYSADTPIQQVMPEYLNGLAVQLQNAADEMDFLRQAQELPPLPGLGDLQQLAIPPFDSTKVISPTAGCFLLSQQGSRLRLLIENHGYHIDWQTKQVNSQVDNGPAACIDGTTDWTPLDSGAHSPL